jgi:tRNA(Ile)-lysidine synthase
VIDIFKSLIKDQKLFKEEEKILLAISGGLDSVVMLKLFVKAGVNIGIAHCNFALRNQESDDDEVFVRNLAGEQKADFFSKRFATEAYAKSRGISIQMAARDLRYEWFEKIRHENGYHYIATAHHADDHAETIILNMTRGAGLAGLQGIKQVNSKIIRPLWSFSRQQIIEYARQEKILFREDSSNPETKYIRNRIRHTVVPVLREINPAFTVAMVNLSEHAAKAQETLAFLIRREFDQHVLIKGDHVVVQIEPLLATPHPEVILYEYLKEFGFSGSIIKEIAAGLSRQPGKIFFSQNFQCLKDRSALIISPLDSELLHEEIVIHEDENCISFPSGELQIRSLMNHGIKTFTSVDHEVFFNAEKIHFPLILRKPREGDWFIPFGMTGKKKISDFLTDKKIPLTWKNKIWLLCSDNMICWVVGMRADNRFRVDNPVQSVLHIKFVSANQ